MTVLNTTVAEAYSCDALITIVSVRGHSYAAVADASLPRCCEDAARLGVRRAAPERSVLSWAWGGPEYAASWRRPAASTLMQIRTSGRRRSPERLTTRTASTKSLFSRLVEGFARFIEPHWLSRSLRRKRFTVRITRFPVFYMRCGWRDSDRWSGAAHIVQARRRLVEQLPQ